MKIAVRVLIYLVLVVLAFWTGRGFIGSFRSGTGARDLTEDALVSTETPRRTAEESVATDTNAAPIEAGVTNQIAETTNSIPSAITNGVQAVIEAGSTNSVAAVVAENGTNAPAEAPVATPTPKASRRKTAAA